MRRTEICLWLALFLSRVVQSEIISLSLVLGADSSEVRYVRGWLDAPAHIDLSETKFMWAYTPGDDDDYYPKDTPVPTTLPPTLAPVKASIAPVKTPSPKPTTAAPVRASRSPHALGPSSAPVGTLAPSAMSVPAPSSSPVAVTSSPVARTSSPVATTASPVATTASPVATTVSPVATTASPVATTPSPVARTRAPARSRTPPPSPPPSGGRDLSGTNGGGTRVKQFLDIVLFNIPEKCKTNAYGSCDWAALGVGIRDVTVSGGVTYCCSEDAVANGSCSSNQMGRLIINPALFQGDKRSVEVPTNDQPFGLAEPVFEIKVTGEYVLLLANCDDYGIDIYSVGSMEWKSVNGYLPGEMFGLMFFNVALTIIYLIMVLWYYCGMRRYQDAAIPIQRYILACIVLGLVEFFFRSLDLGTWNLDGTRSATIIWTAVIIGVLRRGLTRCLFVMVSMGWGVVRDSLGMALVKIIILGTIYCALTMARDVLLVLAEEKVELWSTSTEQELLDLLLIVTLALVVVNAIFFFWILSSLASTTEYLKNMNQTTKLRRHLRLRFIIMTSFVVSFAWLIFAIVDGVVGILNSNQSWLLEGITYLNALFVILSVAILWRPNPNAKDYAMQMELPATGEDGENELELSCVVPSAGEFGEFDDNDDDDHSSSLPVDHAVHS